MEDKTLKDAIKQLKDSSKRNFKQRVDMIVNLKQLDMKNPTNHVDVYVTLPRPKGKVTKVCALVGPELFDQAGKICTTAIRADKFDDYAKDKKKTRRLAADHDYFVAQATIMPKVAQAFGRVLGVRGKMPNPKAGCIVPPNANLQPVFDKLQKTVRLIAKKQMIIQTLVGSEDSKDEDLVENIKHVYNQVLHALPHEKNNVKSIYIKYTMGKPIRIM